MLQLDAYATLVAATLVLLLGRLLVNKIGPLRTFNIPKPVAGGLVVALVLLVLRSTLQGLYSTISCNFSSRVIWNIGFMSFMY